MKWELRLAKSAARELRRFPRSDRKLIAEKLTQLEEDPFRGDVRPLKGKTHKGRYRARVGRYRIIFTPNAEEHVIAVLAILRRAEQTYRQAGYRVLWLKDDPDKKLIQLRLG